MRATAGLLLIAALTIGASAARAETPADPLARSALFKAAFAPNSEPQATATLAPSPLAAPNPAFAVPGQIAVSPAGLMAIDGQSFDFSAAQAWPSALKLSAGDYDFSIASHAGSDLVGSSEAGAMVSVGARMQDKMMTGLNKLGMHTVSSATLADRGRWYVFAAASGREVGLNMSPSLQRLGWSAEATSALISDAQAGVAWRKGATQVSLGYVHREIQGDFFSAGATNKLSDSMVAFSFSIRPR